MKNAAKVTHYSPEQWNVTGDSLATMQKSLLREEQVLLLYGGIPLALFFNVLLSSLLVGIMWPKVNPTLAISWLAILVMVLLWRATLFKIYRKLSANKSSFFWLRHFRISIVATGMVWGAANLLLFPETDILHQVFLAFVLAGVSSAAITSLAPDRISALGFIVPALIPLVVKFLMEGGDMPVSMGLMVAFFLLFLGAASARMQQNLKENIRLRAEAIEQQKAMRESEQRFRYILDTCPTAARISRAGGHDVIFFNQSYAALIDAEFSQINGIDPAKFYANPDDYKDILLRLGNGETILDRLVELRLPHNPGADTKWALASFLPIHFQGGPAILGWFHNITERIRVERMKGEFVSTVSHELRTPLTAISGSLGLIAGGVLGPLPAEMKQMLDIAYKNSQQLTLLINDLLDMDKLVEGKLPLDMQMRSLKLLLEQAIESNRGYGVERSVKLNLLQAEHDVQVNVDSQRFKQVLSNLLSNAIKYSPQNGMVEISITHRDNVARVVVSDRGAGIPKEFRARIFQKFAQADSSDTRAKGGTGLGLAITRELVERMQGKIGFDSIEGVGTNFYIEFPIFLVNV